METWLEQPGIAILRHGNMLLGFHRQAEADTQGMFTFFYASQAEVDAMHERLKDVADDRPRDNQKYRIYHFFAKDPEGRSVEFQQFLHAVDVPGRGQVLGAGSDADAVREPGDEEP